MSLEKSQFRSYLKQLRKDYKEVAKTYSNFTRDITLVLFSMLYASACYFISFDFVSGLLLLGFILYYINNQFFKKK